MSAYAPFGQPSDDEAKQRADMGAHLEALQLLVESSGWSVMRAYLDGEIQSVTGSISDFKGLTAESALKASVALGVLTRIRDLPETVIGRLMQSLAPAKR